jgi:hypothetical protein
MGAVVSNEDRFKARCLEDTGFLCRNLLGWNYDTGKNGEPCNVGTGGIRAEGVSGEANVFLDDPTQQFKLLMMPRDTYKTTRMQGFCVRQILRNPDVRILYGMKNRQRAQEFSQGLRNALKSDEVIAYFGKQLADESDVGGWTVLSRKKKHLKEPTFTTFSIESPPTGGHYDFIIGDDLIDHETCRTTASIEWSHKVSRLLFPLRLPSTITMYVGTFYDEEDLYHEIAGKGHYDSFICGSGVRVIKLDDGSFDLEELPGGLTFPHHSMEFLRTALMEMSSKGQFFDFSCQYLNEVPTASLTAFQRAHFVPQKWDRTLAICSGYLLTDTATSQREEACYSVVAYVGIDQSKTHYLMDLRVGHFTVDEYVHRFIEVLEKWQTRVNHIGEVWEGTALTTVFQYPIEMFARVRNLKLNSIVVPRSGAQSKFSRVDRLVGIFGKGRFRVCDTVPRTFVDVTGEKELWNPLGHKDPHTQIAAPSGELVNEFLRLRQPGTKTDIADALALIMEIDRSTEREIIRFRKPPSELIERAGLTDGYQSREPSDSYEPRGSYADNWWQQTTSRLRGSGD